MLLDSLPEARTSGDRTFPEDEGVSVDIAKIMILLSFDRFLEISDELSAVNLDREGMFVMITPDVAKE